MSAMPGCRREESMVRMLSISPLSSDFAPARGLRVAMQGTGHNAVPMGPLDDTMLVKTERMRGVEIDESNCIARGEAGALWTTPPPPASGAGLAPLAGSSPDVGVVGYTLGGGLSWLGRKYGLAANRLLSAEVVTADGRLVHASRHENPDLFWALRGGGGNDGAVVEDAGRAAELLAPLRELGPEIDTFADIPPVGLSRIHMDPEEPMPGISDTMMLDSLDAETVDALVGAAGPGSGSPLLMVELRHLGGALGRYAGGALSRFDGEYLYFAAGIPMDPAVVAALEAHFAIVGSALAPQSSGRHYLNFAERKVDPVAFYGEETYARLRRVKAEADPLEIFRG